MRLLSAVVVVFALESVAGAGSIAGQAPQLTTEDSARIRLAVVQAIVDTVGRHQPPARIWILPSIERDSVSGQNRRIALTASEWKAIADEYPHAKQIEQLDSVFDCPPGVRVQMPGTGCPILDGGIIIQVGRMQVFGDSLRASAVLIQSSQGARRVATWAQGLWVVFRYAGGFWRRHALQFLWIT